VTDFIELNMRRIFGRYGAKLLAINKERTYKTKQLVSTKTGPSQAVQDQDTGVKGKSYSSQ